MSSLRARTWSDPSGIVPTAQMAFIKYFSMAPRRNLYLDLRASSGGGSQGLPSERKNGWMARWMNG